MIHLKWIKTIYIEISLNSNCKSIEYIFPIQNCAISLLILTYTNLSSCCHKMWFVPESCVWCLPDHSPAGLWWGRLISSAIISKTAQWSQFLILVYNYLVGLVANQEGHCSLSPGCGPPAEMAACLLGWIFCKAVRTLCLGIKKLKTQWLGGSVTVLTWADWKGALSLWKDSWPLRTHSDILQG